MFLETVGFRQGLRSGLVGAEPLSIEKRNLEIIKNLCTQFLEIQIVIYT